ncbi:MAG TPA: branched-chain amino acid ABC transporter permease [Acidimicrobiales bacterium]|nr:branched-chain amino acid ABC transporter permease [Acidimicrobiales bacterium]
MTTPSDSSGAATEPAIGTLPEALAEPTVAEGAQPSIWPPVPRLVLGIRIAIGVALSVVALYAPFYFTPENNRILSQAIYLSIAAMGLNLLTGFNGQVSIGHGAFFGVGAFTTAILMVDYDWTFEATIPVAAALSGLVGLLVGFPALRVRGLYLALVTLGLAVLFPRVASKYVDGTGGVALLRPQRSGFASLIDGLDDDQWAYFVCLAIAVVLFVLAWNLVRGRMGRAMIAVRDQEIAATTVGVNLAGTKVGTFALSAAYAGVAGSLSVMINRIADATNPILYFQLSIEFLVAMVIGGAATILGPAVGAFILVFLRRNTEDLIEGKEILAPAIFGAALIAIVFVLPEGVVGGVRRLLARLGRRSAGTPAARPAPASASDVPNDSTNPGGSHEDGT